VTSTYKQVERHVCPARLQQDDGTTRGGTDKQDERTEPAGTLRYPNRGARQKRFPQKIGHFPNDPLFRLRLEGYVQGIHHLWSRSKLGDPVEAGTPQTRIWRSGAYLRRRHG
jgi:hypothetical protein